MSILADIRLNNKSQPAGFTKEHDLEFSLSSLCGCRYEYCVECAPSEELLSACRHEAIDWGDYERQYISLMKERDSARNFYRIFYRYRPVQ